MSQAYAPDLDLTRTVALARLGARRWVAAAAAVGTRPPHSTLTGFADTEPLLFRSEAFAEDVVDVVLPVAATPGRSRRDVHVVTTGAAVLRQTLQALKLKLW